MAVADSHSASTQRRQQGRSAGSGHEQHGAASGPEPDESGLQEVEHEAETLKDRALAAYNKFNNDWTMNLASMLSYNVLTSFFPLLLAVLTILVSLPIVSHNVPQIASQINSIMPSNVRSQINVGAILRNVRAAGGVLAIVSIVGLLWGGTNLFGTIENCFAIIFRVKVRNFLQQKIMSVVMILLFVILLPISFASSIFLTAANTTLSRVLPGFFSGIFGEIVSYAASLGSLFVLFLAIYTVIPNIPVAWRDAWKGALVAAVAMWVINTIFPFYTAHFVSTKQYSAAAIATAIVTITWFWFFSVVLLVGAQINSLVMGLGPWPFDISRMLMDYRVPAPPGEPTALDAQRRKDHGDFLPFSGIARDSQDVHDVILPSGTVETRKEAEKGAEQKRTDKDDDHDASPGGGLTAGTPQNAGALANRQPSDTSAAPVHAEPPGDSAVRQPHDDRQPHRAHSLGGQARRHDEHQHGAAREPRPAHAMASDLIATDIAPGGVKMEPPRAVFGQRRGPPRTMLIAGAVVGLLTGLAGSRRHDDPA